MPGGGGVSSFLNALRDSAANSTAVVAEQAKNVRYGSLLLWLRSSEKC